MGASGANPISRLAGNRPMLPAAQGYISTQSRQPAPWGINPVPGPSLGTVGARWTWIGTQWAPGQGGDTPGGGGAALIGEVHPVETLQIVDGYVVPRSAQGPAKTGWFSWAGGRRSGA